MIEQVNENPDCIEPVCENDIICAKKLFKGVHRGVGSHLSPRINLGLFYTLTSGKGHVVYPGYFFLRNYPEGK